MTNKHLRAGRLARRWTQKQAARRLGVSQPYLAMLEGGQRRLTPAVVRKAMGVLRLPATVLPLPPRLEPPQADSASFANQVAALGYPGFAYLRSRGTKRNPAEVLLAALAQDDLEARVFEALPWLLLQYWDMDSAWLVEQAKRLDLQNRLGYVVGLARHLSERTEPHDNQRTRSLAALEAALEPSRLAREDTLCRKPATGVERTWLMENRPADAKHWNLLTDWRPEHFNYGV
jgi:transcriptional regulator with XRE-family HTH domain